MMNEHLFLTGFMGAGKTSVGKLLSERLNSSVVDTDEYIEAMERKTIKEIFQQQGETKFRDLETKVLKEIIGEKAMVITTGGGIIIRDENRRLMNERGKVIFLYCNLDETMRRLENDCSRPLFKANLEANRKLFEERLPLYRQANIIVETTNKSLESIVDEIQTYLE